MESGPSPIALTEFYRAYKDDYHVWLAEAHPGERGNAAYFREFAEEELGVRSFQIDGKYFAVPEARGFKELK